MIRNEHTERWVAALRSGDWRQTTGHLKREGGYCCLGVLAELLGQLDTDDVGRGSVAVGGGRLYQILPPSVRDVVGMTDSESGTLSSLNDLGTTFLDIADKIEEMCDAEDRPA